MPTVSCACCLMPDSYPLCCCLLVSACSPLPFLPASECCPLPSALSLLPCRSFLTGRPHSSCLAGGMTVYLTLEEYLNMGTQLKQKHAGLGSITGDFTPGRQQFCCCMEPLICHIILTGNFVTTLQVHNLSKHL